MADALYDEIEKIHGEIATQERDRLVLNEPPRVTSMRDISRGPNLTVNEIKHQIVECMEMVRNQKYSVALDKMKELCAGATTYPYPDSQKTTSPKCRS